MSIALLVMADGRETELAECMKSLRRHGDEFSSMWLHDDTGDERYRTELARRYPMFSVLGDGPRRGCAGAIRYAWEVLRTRVDAQYVFHFEQDFVLRGPAPLNRMRVLLRQYPYLAQVALRRNPVNSAEIAAGGVIEQHQDWYTQKRSFFAPTGHVDWLEHNAYFTCNPCMYRRTLLSLGWPEHIDGRYSEDTFHHDMLMRYGTPEATPSSVRYAYYGCMEDAPLVEHVGSRHAEGTGY